MKIKLKELLDNRYDARYKVRSYYDSALKGLEDDIETDDWEEVEDFAHEHVSNGGYVKITDNKTGVEKILDYDTYFGEDGENFNGEFPLSVTDFDPNYFNKEESMLKENTELKYLFTVAPWGGGRNRESIEDELEQNVENAKKLGYKIINRPYQHRGRSGSVYDYEESSIEVQHGTSASRGKLNLSKTSNLGKHYDKVKSEYNDVIVLPITPILTGYVKNSRGFRSASSARYVVMAKDKKVEESMLKEGDTYFYNTKHTPDSVYWYSTKHGFGPGAFPNGATVLDVVEDDENPYKIYIATDKLLNTKALNDFDLKEERPKDETRFSTKDFTNAHFTGKRKVDNFESKNIKESKETAIKTKVVPVKWDENNKKKVYSFGDKDSFGKALWYDDEGNAYELIYARKANAYSLNPYPYYNKQK